MIFFTLCIIILIPGVISQPPKTMTLFSQDNINNVNNVNNINKVDNIKIFPGKPRLLKPKITDNVNRGDVNIIAPLIITTTAAVAGVQKYYQTNNTVKALTVAGKVVASGAISVTAYHTCNYLASSVFPGGIVGPMVGTVCSCGSSYLYDLIFDSSSSNTYDTFSEDEINFMKEAFSDDKKIVKFNDNTDEADATEEYDRKSAPKEPRDDEDDDSYETYRINESDNPKIRDLRIQLRKNTSHKNKVLDQKNLNKKFYDDLIETNKKNPNSVHPDLITKYAQIVKNLDDECNRLKQISNNLVHLIVEKAILDELNINFQELST